MVLCTPSCVGSLLFENACAGAQRWCSRNDGAVDSSDSDFNFTHSLTLDKVPSESSTLAVARFPLYFDDVGKRQGYRLRPRGGAVGFEGRTSRSKQALGQAT